MTIALWVLVGVGIIVVFTGWGLMSSLTSTGLRLADSIDRHARHLHREMRRLRRTLTREPLLPVRVIGHMHLDPPPVDAEVVVNSTWLNRRERLADGPWTWVITDPAGVVLRQVPAQPIEYEELSKDEVKKWLERDPDLYALYEKRDDPSFSLSREVTADHKRQAMRAEAERAAREVFPVCSVRAAACGYGSDPLEDLSLWAYDIIL